MGNTSKTILLLILILTGCTKKENIILNGELGDRFKSKIFLTNRGDKYDGYFIYEGKESDKIKLRGVRIGEKLRLEEFNNQEDKLTGIFEGKFDEINYNGFWSAPMGEKKVPFSYSSQREIETDKDQVSKISEKEKINRSYQRWVDEKVADGEYWHMAKREQYHKENWNKESSNGDDYWDNCLDGLPDEFKNAHYGDINRDGKIDAYGTIFPFYCMDGTWQINADIHLLFLSNQDGNYKVIYEPQSISSEIGPAGRLDTILSDGTMRYTGIDYGPNDAHCCPSKEWKVEFQYDREKFKKK